MGLLAPLALLGLAAVAVPVLVHLTQRDRSEEIPFPTLMFLERIPYQAVRKQKIRHLLLFSLRVGALALLALAFARPFFGGEVPVAAGSGAPVDRVVVLDRSMSMQAGDRWADAVSAARDAVRGVPAGGRSALVHFTDEPIGAAPLSVDPTLALTVLDTLRPNDRATRLAPALQVAASLLDDPDRDREVVLISDLQTSAWPEGSRYALPEGVSLQVRGVGGSEANPHLAGLRVLTAAPGEDPETDPGRVRVSALVADASGLGPDAEVILELDGTEVDRASLTGDGRPTVPVSLEAPLGDRAQPTGTLRLVGGGARGLATDDVLRFVAGAPIPVQVLVLDDSPDGAESLYLERALSVGTAPSWAWERIPTQRLTATALQGVDVVVLNDVPPPGGGARRALEDHLDRGGGVLLALGPNATDGWDSWPRSPVTTSDGVDLEGTRGGRMTELALDHPIFEPFRQEGSGDFSRARFFRARPAEVRDTTAEILARFSGGGAALVEAVPAQPETGPDAGSSGSASGRLLVWTTSLDDFWTDLPRQAVFLPFLHQTLQYAAGYQAPTVAWYAGESLDRAALLSMGAGPETSRVRSPSGQTWDLPEDGRSPAFSETGFWAATGADAESYFAVNPVPEESELAPLDADALSRQVAGSAGTGASIAGSELQWSDADRESRQSIWRFLVMAALTLLVVETVVTARSRARVT
jgi:hypothetical protein